MKRTGGFRVVAVILVATCFAGCGKEQQTEPPKVNGGVLADPETVDALPYWRSIRQGDVGAYIDQTGKVVLQTDLNVIQTKGAMQLFDFGTEPVARIRHGQLLWGLIDRTGKVIVDPRYEGMGLPAFGVVPVQLHGRWGLIDYQGNEVMPIRYLQIATFSEGLGLVRATPAQATGQWPDNDLEKRASELLAKVQDRDPAKRHMAVQELLKIGDPVFETRAFTETAHGARSKNKNVELGNLLKSITSMGMRYAKYGYIGPTGDFVIATRFGLATPFQDGRACVADGHTRGYIDRDGRLVFHGWGDGFSSGLARLIVDGRAVFVDNRGKTAIEPAAGQTFPMPGFSERRARFKQTGKYGYIDASGRVVIEAKYELASNFSDGLAMVSRGRGENREFAYIDRAGELVIHWRKGRWYESFEGGLALFRDSRGVYKMLNKKGELVYNSGSEILWRGVNGR